MPDPMPSALALKVDGKDATITTTPSTAFKIMRALLNAGHVVQTKERGQFRDLTPAREEVKADAA